MKLKKKIKLLSFVLAFMAAVMLLPLGTLTAYAAENESQIDEITADETATYTQSIADPPADDEPVENTVENTELETEVLYYEYEIENSAMSTPPMTDIVGSADPNALELPTSYLPSGVYEIENVGNDNYYMSVENGSVDSGFRVVQQNYGSNTPLTSFSRASLFKVTRIGETNRYIIRAMTNNRLTICSDTDINEGEIITDFIATDDADALGHTYTIVSVGSICTIQPYGSSDVIVAPNSTISGDTNADTAQLILTTQSAAGSRGKWRFTPYTGNIQYGYHVYRTAGMGDGLVKGKTGTIWLKTWSTVINANTPYLSIKSPYSSVATANWQANNYLATITAHKSGDYQMDIQIRTGSSTAATHTLYSTYTVIPDIVGDTAFVENVATSKYMEVESASTANGGVVQQWQFHTGKQAQWIFELGGGGYFKIKNVNSGKYLGVDSSDTTKVKQYTTVTDYTLWKLTETSNGRYKISCKASALSGKVLSTPQSTSANGTDLTMLSYVSDSDYKDEWVIKEVLPVSGSEIAYNTSLWNYQPVVEGTNCYAYSLNNQVIPGSNYLWYMQPGEIAGEILTTSNLNKDTIIDFVEKDADVLGFTFCSIGKHEVCPSGTYKVALVISESPQRDYHWYRQNPDGTWSHKPGRGAVINTDASGNIIFDPEFADRNYSYANYSIFVGFFKVTPLNNMYSPSRMVGPQIGDITDLIQIDENKINLPSLEETFSVCRGMQYSEVASVMGHPQRIVTFGLTVVQYDLDSGDTVLIEYLKNEDGSYIVERVKIMLTEEK